MARFVAKEFDPGKLFQPSLMFAGMARSLPTKLGVGERSKLGPYSKNFILFVTYEWVLLARVLHYTRLRML
jgi:hypothetical protein